MEYSRREREKAATLTLASPEVHGWIGHLTRNGGTFPSFPLDLGASDEPKPAIGSRFDLADADECEQFGAVCKAHGSNFIGGVFAALAITEHELVGRDRYMALSPLTTRNDPQFYWSQGWFINLIPVGFALEDATTFTGLAQRAQDAYRSGKALGEVSVQQVIDTVLAQAGPEAMSQHATTLAPPPIVSYIDGRRLPQTESFVSTRATGIVGWQGHSDRVDLGQPHARGHVDGRLAPRHRRGAPVGDRIRGAVVDHHENRCPRRAITR